jgi:hypothetical protein
MLTMVVMPAVTLEVMAVAITNRLPSNSTPTPTSEYNFPFDTAYGLLRMRWAGPHPPTPSPAAAGEGENEHCDALPSPVATGNKRSAEGGLSGVKATA